MGKNKGLTFTTVDFDPVGHLYKMPDGTRWPSFSEIAQFTGHINFDGIPVHFLERKKILGRAVHLATEYLDKGILDEDALDQEQKGYLNAYKEFKETMGFKPVYLEPHLANETYGYCCTPDKIGLIKGAWSIVELKSGVLMPHHEMQVEAQADCIKERVKKYVLCLKENGKFSIHPYNEPTRAKYIRNVWLSSVALFHYLKKRKNDK